MNRINQCIQYVTDENKRKMCYLEIFVATHIEMLVNEFHLKHGYVYSQSGIHKSIFIVCSYFKILSNVLKC